MAVGRSRLGIGWVIRSVHDPAADPELGRRTAHNLAMHAVFADPKTDFVFKRIFGAESRKPLLIALLNHLLELDGERRIVEVRHLTGDQHVDVPELKLSIVEVKCVDATGRHFVVEMQIPKVEGFEKRVVYNASKAYLMQLRNAEEDPALCR